MCVSNSVHARVVSYAACTSVYGKRPHLAQQLLHATHHRRPVLRRQSRPAQAWAGTHTHTRTRVSRGTSSAYTQGMARARLCGPARPLRASVADVWHAQAHACVWAHACARMHRTVIHPSTATPPHRSDSKRAERSAWAGGAAEKPSSGASAKPKAAARACTGGRGRHGV
jgi:hypothetical protein